MYGLSYFEMNEGHYIEGGYRNVCVHCGKDGLGVYQAESLFDVIKARRLNVGVAKENGHGDYCPVNEALQLMGKALPGEDLFFRVSGLIGDIGELERIFQEAVNAVA